MTRQVLPRAAILTIDLGNSGGSAALFEHGEEPVGCGAWTTADDDSAELSAAVDRALGRVTSRAELLAAVSAVGSHDREASAVDRLRSLGLAVEAHPDPGLDLRIEHPETCGSDRKYAARGAVGRARTRSGRGLVVIDAGTALTVDAVLAPDMRDGVDGERGAFLGGAIALGPGSLADALTEAGARLPAIDLTPDVDALGRSTDAALRSGVVVGFRGAVRELCREVAIAAHGSPDDVVAAYLTGGARAFARAAVEEVFPGRVVEDPQLVHRGLALAAAEVAR